MIYVFDTSPLRVLFNNYYRNVFKSLWRDFDQLVADGHVLSTREVGREIEVCPVPSLREWAVNHKDLFPTPTPDEALFLARLFRDVPHFQNNIEMKKLLAGGLVADPFVIARAACVGATVVTMETFKKNSADIPAICDHCKIRWLSLEEFMNEEGWTF